ncbi:uncharacterized protein CcaverHIS019_0200320 [Cutaneotrichosporon cavernicola]|uniref:Uncharacterized protein n=1 Tax=Cutaneotrichosporon cavernicola TaxID=279322 RepID=A0AA48L0U2_9TREE|nr:uncharacterized protein CcaverHIS019_0200320 [Cutaneotrichosporon cavernicola]BEI88670.1 hypothetical protein CcaverHIS019_0200320 [Cutaneotrichosporon cavernicola]
MWKSCRVVLGAALVARIRPVAASTRVLDVIEAEHMLLPGSYVAKDAGTCTALEVGTLQSARHKQPGNT